MNPTGPEPRVTRRIFLNRNAQAGNEEVFAEVKPHRDRLIPFAIINPSYAGWQDDLKICQEDFGMSGLRLYPKWHNEIGQLIAGLGAERSVLGTGMPFSYPDPALLKLEVLPASKEDKEKIGGQNIAQWLRL